MFAMVIRIALTWGLALIALGASHAFAQNQAWIRQFGTSLPEQGVAAAIDGSGGVYATGYTLGSLGGPAAGGLDAWLTRFDSTGNQIWIRQLGTSAHDWLHAAAMDMSGGVY